MLGRKALEHALQHCSDEIVHHITHMNYDQSYTFDWADIKVIVHCCAWSTRSLDVYSILYYNKQHVNYGPEYIALTPSVISALMHIRHDRYVLLQNIDDVEMPFCDSHIVYVLQKHRLEESDEWVLL